MHNHLRKVCFVTLLALASVAAPAFADTPAQALTHAVLRGDREAIVVLVRKSPATVWVVTETSAQGVVLTPSLSAAQLASGVAGTPEAFEALLGAIGTPNRAQILEMALMSATAYAPVELKLSPEEVEKRQVAKIGRLLARWPWLARWSNKEGSLLTSAISADFPAMVGLLLEKGADPETDGGWAAGLLHIAPSPRMVGLLVGLGYPVNGRGMGLETPLHTAVARKKPSMIAALCAVGAEREALDALGNTPLMEACRLGSTEAVSALLDQGADPNRWSLASNLSPLDRCYAQPDLVRLLVSGGARLDARNGLGDTPLLAWAREFLRRGGGRPDVGPGSWADVLKGMAVAADLGADLRARDSRGFDIVALLLRHGKRFEAQAREVERLVALKANVPRP
jgi:hypothetical protein